jgi:hypothetical protein
MSGTRVMYGVEGRHAGFRVERLEEAQARPVAVVHGDDEERVVPLAAHFALPVGGDGRRGRAVSYKDRIS